MYVSIYLSTPGINYLQIATAVFICLWSAVYKKCWDRELRYIDLKWGLEGLEEAERDRPQFYGDINSGDQGRKRSAVTNRMETYYPEEKRGWRKSLTFVVMLLLVAVVCVETEGLMWAWDLLENKKIRYAEIIVSAIFAVVIRGLSAIYKEVAAGLNDWENYRTETEYEDALIFKMLFFEVFNNFGALFYVAFIKGPVYGCGKGGLKADCMGDLEVLMIIIFIVRLMYYLLEIMRPIIKRALLDNHMEDMGEDKSIAYLTEEGNASELIKEEFEAEVALDTYEGTFDDYTKLILQYGYVNMFMLPFPTVAFLVSSGLVSCQ